VYVVFDTGLTTSDPDVAPPVEKLFPTHAVVFVELHERSDDCPLSIDDGTAESVAVGVGSASTVTCTHAPQLFFSFDSSMTPFADAFWSAQSCVYHTPGDGKVTFV